MGRGPAVGLSGLDTWQWDQLAHLASVSGMRRTAYVRRVLASVCVLGYTLRGTYVRQPTWDRAAHKVTRNLRIDVPVYLMQGIIRYQQEKRFPSQTMLTFQAVAYAIAFGMTFDDEGVKVNHACERCIRHEERHPLPAG